MKISLIASAATSLEVLSAYAGNARDYGYWDFEIVVVGDREDADAWRSRCESISRNAIPCRLLSIATQREILQPNCPELAQSLRFDSTRRLHIGFLDAWRNGASILIAIHPTSPPGKSDFVGAHCKALATRRQFQLRAQGDWFNLGATMAEESSTPFALRGFPPQISVQQQIPPVEVQQTSIAASVGMLTGASDLSAATRLRSNLRILGPQPELPQNFTLPVGVWSPFSTFNFAIWRDCVPAFFLTPYAGRFGDIWASFVLTRISHHLGQHISFGSPSLEVAPSTSDAHRDFESELVGYRQSLRLATALRSIPLSGTTFHECFGQIAAALPTAWPELPGASGIEIEARNRLFAGLAQWHELFSTIAARSAGNLFESIEKESSTQPAPKAISNFT